MTTSSETPEAVLDHHLTAFNEGDMGELLADYTDESVIISNMGEFQGLDEIEQLFTGLMEEFSQPGTEFVVDDNTFDEEIAFCVWHADTPDNDYEFATDTQIIRDGKIAKQILSAKVNPK